MKPVRIGTRRSQLAKWQANYVADLLLEHFPEVEIEIVPIETEGDRRLDVVLSELGGKGLFIKELERELSDDRIDIAVHSMKDVTVHLAEEYCIPAILERGNPYDAFVSNEYASIDELPQNAVVGTSSLRRQSQLLRIRSDLTIQTLRGNVPTRLGRLGDGDFDAIILAVSGLQRLNLEHHVTQQLSGSHHVPSPGQGAVGVECRSSDTMVQELIASLNHELSYVAVSAERTVNLELGGNCHVPIGIHATIENGRIFMSASVSTPDGQNNVCAQLEGSVGDWKVVALNLAEILRFRGAEEILDDFQQA